MSRSPRRYITMGKATEPKKLQAIIDLYTTGMAVSEVAEIMQLHPASIHRILSREGVRETDAKAGKRLTDETKVEILKMYKQGVTVDNICSNLAVSKPTVYQYVKDAGLSRDIAKEAVEDALRLYRDTSKTVAEICRATGISKATFYRRLKKSQEEQS